MAFTEVIPLIWPAIMFDTSQVYVNSLITTIYKVKEIHNRIKLLNTRWKIVVTDKNLDTMTGA
jgi:hypothetical protein